MDYCNPKPRLHTCTIRATILTPKCDVQQGLKS